MTTTSAPPTVSTTTYPTSGTYKLKVREHSARGRPFIGAEVPEAAWVLRAVELAASAPPGNRFDDSERRYAVAYSGTTVRACLLELLQIFRPHAATLDEVRRQTESLRRGQVLACGVLPAAWLADREIVLIAHDDPSAAANVASQATWTWLNMQAAVTTLIRRTLGGVDASLPPVVTATVIMGQGRSGRAISQKISTVIHRRCPEVHGIRYLSNTSLDEKLECWATFLDRAQRFEVVDRRGVDVTDPDVAGAIDDLGIATPWLNDEVRGLMTIGLVPVWWSLS